MVSCTALALSYRECYMTGHFFRAAIVRFGVR
jgi:hypothetical protein